MKHIHLLNLVVIAFFSLLNFHNVDAVEVDDAVKVDDAVNCNVTVDRFNYDLTNLEQEKINRTTDTPPSKKVELYYVSPCKPLNVSIYEDKDDEGDYCGEDTYVCQVLVYTKEKKDKNGEKEETRLVAEVQQIAANDEKNLLNASFSLASLEDNDKVPPLLLTLNGGTDKGESHQAKFTFICSEEDSTPTFKRYDNGILEVEWKISTCSKKPLDPDENQGRGFTKFLTIVSILILTYLGIGAAYNYHVYRAQGWDLIPNRDFWRDVPYLISDVLKYVVRACRGGRSGYSGV
ncbi:2278_t:CDS:2 [Ambispora gerdemannii]|uniref:Autophagy-related protein 27 n=1 Tax=Ambispora gerdemannii TaxID=144530 RepID=A0A9N9BM93_9GLOM|nr:2278_t:CDS:2 [Ambispora gerdemannii]